MDSTEESQQLEITVLQSIYGDDFIECPPPKAWKGAARLHEFIIRVYHHDSPKVNLHLHIKFPKTYPLLACPIFAVEMPIQGLNDSQVAKLSHEINIEAQRQRGFEMVFHIVTFVQDWISANVTPPVEVAGSLALQMSQRALDEERARRQREIEETEREEELAIRAAQELDEQLKADAMEQMLAREEQRTKARRRANSEATEVPSNHEVDTPTETYNSEMQINGVSFNTVKLYHPRPACLGLVYRAEPIVDNIASVLPLEHFVVSFEDPYYNTTQGRKKLKQVEQEILKLTTVQHPKLLSVFGVKLTSPHSGGPPQLMVLTEQAPHLTLHDVLEDCESLREDRALDYLSQILTALQALHLSDLVHRGITARCIGLAPRDHASQPKMVKLAKAAYHTRLLDLHRSNSFGPNTPTLVEDTPTPEAWLSRDVQNESALLYTRQRDIHAVGIVFLQMLMGLEVTDHYQDMNTVVNRTSISPVLARTVMSMLQPTKRNGASCSSLLAELNDGNPKSPVTSKSFSFAFEQKTPAPLGSGSPETSWMPAEVMHRAKQTSRWKEDWEELELLGKGGFGSVVKAKNKIDGRIYAVKKVRLKTMQSDSKIFREVNALSRLSHRNIVRYYTTWVETAELSSSVISDDSSTEDGLTSIPDDDANDDVSERHLPINGAFKINIEDFDDISISGSSFPSIHFERSSSPGTSSSEEDEFGSLFRTTSGSSLPQLGSAPCLTRTLYIQMEFVERQTLRELVEEGLSENEAWRLFLQIVEALTHMSTLGILHRDIKLTNIFIDAKGDCKVGDFGLATSSLAAVDPSDVSLHVFTPDADMTLEVGTRLYISPEVQSRKRGPRNHSKADMYSLGIVFFEMNYAFTTGAERIAVLEYLRKPGVFFPQEWDPQRTRQKEIITWLLQHEPDKRPTALELSQSALLPPRLEDEYFKGALRMMAKPDSPHHQAVLNSLFRHVSRPSRAYLYDNEAELPDYATLNGAVQERLAAIFHLHGAVDMEPPLLMPMMDPEEEHAQATFIDRHGDVVTLPNNILIPFARLAARGSSKRIKRYHIANVYRSNPIAGHPKVQKAALFDIITPDLEFGPIAAGAEIIAVINDCLDSFPNLSQNYDIHISHSKIVEIAMNRIPADLRGAVIDTLHQSKIAPAQKRAVLQKKGLLRTTLDELDILSEVGEDIDDIIGRLEKGSPTLAILMQSAIQELKSTIRFSQSAGVTRPVFFHPLMLGAHHMHFKDGVLVEVVRRNKHSDVLAAGGRYDNLIARFPLQNKNPGPICALGIQIAVEKITAALASFQSTSTMALVKEERSFGFWSPRRCDVYVVSYAPGHLQDRLEVVAYLWKHNISADLMYETGLPDMEHGDHVETCKREGILFTVYPRPRAGRNLPAFKVKSILKSTEVDLSRQELVGWLQHHIAEQKRVDATTSGATVVAEMSPNLPVTKDATSSPDVQLVLPDPKKQRKGKQRFLENAFERTSVIKSSFQNGMPVLVIDVAPAHFEAMTRSAAWITDEEAWKPISAMFPPQYFGYGQSVREAAIKRKSEGHAYILLYAAREDRAQLLALA